ncbi:hypothetical protein E5F05_01930 (plasmid) [Deinococcus metallilatus]|uniref:Uncharacterized protein n=1 Tax=Deinococcus metallilatus TaxID=1211322 RepID=A0ABR6MZW5_9DEIO|nr:hypothetical protein [Deinococcus metallilatus]MBB5297498.1 hypothetical protein [Deinococcus metallilatus]QBY06729.1 hypothetical protein E5F05_01930 [Deinococcus metallilatus]GMA14388.1 hypothetical protein GCM10025871_07190 [Deinococcus metallilatus]
MSTFGLYPWFVEHGLEKIHPEDIEDFSKLLPYGKVFELISNDGDYITIAYGSKRYRVRPDLWKPVEGVGYHVGEQVLVNGRKGVIEEIGWHFNRKSPFFLLSIEGKRKSKRYSGDELQTL